MNMKWPMRVFVAALCLALLLSGCGSIPKYQEWTYADWTSVDQDTRALVVDDIVATSYYAQEKNAVRAALVILLREYGLTIKQANALLSSYPELITNPDGVEGMMAGLGYEKTAGT